MHPVVLIIVGVLTIGSISGCKPSMPAERLRQALVSTNSILLRYTGEPITLTAQQSESLKRIIQQFENKSVVEVQRELLPAPFGHFACNAIRFAWLGSRIYYKDQATGRYLVIKDDLLESRSQEYMKSLGETLPLRSPTTEDWIRILAVLE
jgi:hypothetical protein